MPDQVPHLAVPFRVVGDRAVTVEQDSDSEVTQCVEVILRYRPGARVAAPDFGTPDQAHRQGGADIVTLVEHVERFEPRARVLAEHEGMTLGEFVDRVRVSVERREAEAFGA
jgi:phage baseplate assembly protein W